MAVVYSFRDPIIRTRLDSTILQGCAGHTKPHRYVHNRLHGHRPAENDLHGLLAARFTVKILTQMANPAF